MSAPLGMPVSTIAPEYDVIVVGSGYGAGIAACRFARAGHSVAIFERGREWPSASFPSDLASAAGAVAIAGRAGGRRVGVGARASLLELHVSDDLDVLVGRGLGGTSLVNASVFLEPDPRIWADSRWPRALRDDRQGLLEGAAAAAAMLEPRPYPEGEPGFAPLPKARFVRDAARALGAGASRPPLMTYFGPDRETASGVSERACNGCGDCVSGCRNEAKRTVDRTYIADARSHGAHVFCEIDVRAVERDGDRWRVHFCPVTVPIERDLPEPFVRAARVIIAGGVFGSTAFLYRSRARGLAVSEALGTQVSANGNRVLAVDGAGIVARSARTGLAGEHGPGPCITEAALASAADLEDSFVVEDGAVPSSLAAFAAAAATRGELARAPASGLVERLARSARTLAASVAEEAIGTPRSLQILLMQAHDDASGRLAFDCEHGDVSLVWPRFGDGIRTTDAEVSLDAVARSAGGRARALGVPLPLGSQHVTVHPLGGCPMGDDRDTGVVDHLGRVFDASSPDRAAVHDGLFVLDASIIPRSLGTNPVWAISALAERAMAHVVTMVGPAHARAPAQVSARETGAAFSEAFSGWVSEEGRVPFEENAFGELGPLVEAVELRLVITVDDVDEFLRDPVHPAHAVGTLRCALLGPRPLTAIGTISLFSDDPVRESTYYETYRLDLMAEGGERFELRAMKTFTDGSPVRVFGDGTHLPITIGGRSLAGGRRLTGVLTMPATKLLATVAGVSTHRAPGLRARARAGAKFRAFFARRWLERVRLSGNLE